MGRVVIERWECRLLRGLSRGGRWVLVYGRRKTGKTWLLRRCWDWVLYATVTGDGACIVEERGRGPRLVPVQDCIGAAASLIRRIGDGGVVVDEFQRLPRRYWELLAAAGLRLRGGWRSAAPASPWRGRCSPGAAPCWVSWRRSA